MIEGPREDRPPNWLWKVAMCVPSGNQGWSSTFARSLHPKQKMPLSIVSVVINTQWSNKARLQPFFVQKLTKIKAYLPSHHSPVLIQVSQLLSAQSPHNENIQTCQPDKLLPNLVHTRMQPFGNEHHVMVSFIAAEVGSNLPKRRESIAFVYTVCNKETYVKCPNQNGQSSCPTKCLLIPTNSIL